MTPFIRDGDAITVSGLGDKPLRLGEVVAFALSDAQPLLVHRIVEAHSGRLLMRGDNASAPDGTISPADVHGRVTRVERGGRKRRFGFGAERYLIAGLSRMGVLHRIVQAAALARGWARNRATAQRLP